MLQAELLKQYTSSILESVDYSFSNQNFLGFVSAIAFDLGDQLFLSFYHFSVFPVSHHLHMDFGLETGDVDLCFVGSAYFFRLFVSHAFRFVKN